jgi:hypothetical protein
MARPLRVEFPDAIYHVMARGNGRQAIFHGDDDYRRLTDGLATTVGGTGWQVIGLRSDAQSDSSVPEDAAAESFSGNAAGTSNRALMTISQTPCAKREKARCWGVRHLLSRTRVCSTNLSCWIKSPKPSRDFRHPK